MCAVSVAICFLSSETQSAMLIHQVVISSGIFLLYVRTQSIDSRDQIFRACFPMAGSPIDRSKRAPGPHSYRSRHSALLGRGCEVDQLGSTAAGCSRFSQPPMRADIHASTPGQDVCVTAPSLMQGCAESEHVVHGLSDGVRGRGDPARCVTAN